MIQLVAHNNIDRSKWDAAVLASDAVQLYGQSWWLDAAAPGWDGLVLDDYEAIMPLTHLQKLGINYLAQPHCTQQLGVFTSASNSALVEEFIATIPAKYKLIQIALNRANTLPEAFPDAKPAHNYELALGRSYEAVRAGYNTNTKRNIAKAEKAGLAITENPGGLRNCIELFKSSKAAEIGTLPEAWYRTLENVIAATSTNAAITILDAHTANGTHAASGVFAEHNGRSVFLFSGNSTAGKQVGALPALLNHYIKANCERLTILDFEGSNSPNLARFYKGFGSDLSLYLLYYHNRLPAPIKWLKREP